MKESEITTIIREKIEKINNLHDMVMGEDIRVTFQNGKEITLRRVK